jgi:hypothetical protein
MKPETDIPTMLQSSIAHDILAELKRLNTNNVGDHTLWNREDVANYLRTSVKTLQNTGIFNSPGFPRAQVIPTSETRPAKLWRAREVIQWAQKIRDVPKKAGQNQKVA